MWDDITHFYITRDLSNSLSSVLTLLNFSLTGFALLSIYLVLKNLIWERDNRIILAFAACSIIVYLAYHLQFYLECVTTYTSYGYKDANRNPSDFRQLLAVEKSLLWCIPILGLLFGIIWLGRLFYRWRQWAPMKFPAYWKNRKHYDSMQLEHEKEMRRVRHERNSNLEKLRLDREAELEKIRKERYAAVLSSWTKQAEEFTVETAVDSPEVVPTMLLDQEEREWWNAQSIEHVQRLKMKVALAEVHQRVQLEIQKEEEVSATELEEAQILHSAKKEVETV